MSWNIAAKFYPSCISIPINKKCTAFFVSEFSGFCVFYAFIFYGFGITREGWRRMLSAFKWILEIVPESIPATKPTSQPSTHRILSFSNQIKWNGTKKWRWIHLYSQTMKWNNPQKKIVLWNIKKKKCRKWEICETSFLIKINASRISRVHKFEFCKVMPWYMDILQWGNRLWLSNGWRRAF